MTLTVTMKDGSVHTVANNANTYLVIDGESFDAGYDWLSGWDYRGDALAPDGGGPSYQLDQLEKNIRYDPASGTLSSPSRRGWIPARSACRWAAG